tara:strand:- start:4257 stop:5780 length:1524 start_codon:yes stop_codon:yes gene_type:complete
MFRRPQAESFINYQLQSSLGRQPTSGKIPIKRRKKTRIKKRKDSFQLRTQDIDKRRSVYRPDRLLALHQSSLNNATRTAQEMGRGLTATGTTLGFERQQIKDADVEKAKGRVLLALANRLESKEPLINVGYSQHRLPDDLNSVRLPDRPPPPPLELGYKEPRPQPNTSHRKPSDDNSNLEPLLQSFDVDDDEADIEDITTPKPQKEPPRVEKPTVGRLDPTRGLQLEEKIIKDKDKNADVEVVRQQAKEQREKARQTQTQTNEPQLRPPKEPEPEPEPVPAPEGAAPSSGRASGGGIYEQWKQAGVVNRGDTDNPPAESGPFAPPDTEGRQPTTTIPKVRENIQKPPTAQQQRVIDAAEESKRKRAEKLKEKFGKLKEDITEPEPQSVLPEPTEKKSRQVEDVADAESPESEWLDNLPDKSSFHSGIATNELTRSTYSFVDTDGLIGKGKFRGKELAILGVNKGGNVLVQLKDTIGTGKVDKSVRANIGFKKFKANLEDFDLKPFSI